jgi:acyl-CoA synthetase
MRPFLTLHEPAKAKRYHAQGTWRDETLYALLTKHARERGDAIAARDGTRRVTWAQMLAWADHIAASLADTGVTAGDRVSIWSDNKLEAVAMFLACSRSGIACNPSLHRTYTSGEIVTLLDRLQSRVLLTRTGWGADGVADGVAPRLKTAASLKAIWTPDTIALPVDRRVSQAGSTRPTAPVTDPDKVVYLAFTSGTTGAPKCVMHSDNSLLANARDLVRDWGHGPNSKILSLSPLSHHIAWVAVAQWLVAGCELITDDPPAGTSRLDWIVETGATYVMGVPTHAMDILAEQKKHGLARLGQVEVFYMAGSPIPPTTAAAFVAQGIKPQNVYGMTENSSHQYTHPHDSTETIVTTCGRGGPAYEVRVFDAANPDVEVPACTVGEIGGRGAALMLGYFDNQTATEKSFNRDGWFMSGDLGVLDAAGNLKIEGRLKDLIIRGGHNIYPAEIEALTLRHAGVTRCAAFPVADERLGERVCLAIIGEVAPAALLDHLAKEGLSKFDMPEYFCRVTAFPLTASGKILKRELIEMTKRGHLKPEPIRYVEKKGTIA